MPWCMAKPLVDEVSTKIRIVRQGASDAFSTRRASVVPPDPRIRSCRRGLAGDGIAEGGGDRYSCAYLLDSFVEDPPSALVLVGDH